MSGAKNGGNLFEEIQLREWRSRRQLHSATHGKCHARATVRRRDSR